MVLSVPDDVPTTDGGKPIDERDNTENNNRKSDKPLSRRCYRENSKQSTADGSQQ